MAQTNDVSLLGLPPELRNRIWELVVFHEPTDGLICPLQDAHGVLEAESPHDRDPFRYKKRDKYVSSVVMVCGARLRIEQFEPVFSFEKSAPGHFPARSDPGQIRGGPAAHRSKKTLRRIWEESPNAKSGHFCAIECLLQPAIARVNVQVRTESLPLFYSVNAFHIEMTNFALESVFRNRHSLCPDPEYQRTPIDWWRAIGNHNLKFIDHLSIFGQCAYDWNENGLMMKYQRRGSGSGIVKCDRRLTERYAHDAKGNARRRERDAERSSKLLELLDDVARDGLSADALENVVRQLEPEDRPYTRESVWPKQPSGWSP